MNSALTPYFIEFKEFSLNYKTIRKQKSGNLGEITLIRNIKNNIIYQMKEETIISESDFNELKHGLEELLPLNSQGNFMKFIGFSLKKNQNFLIKQAENYTSTTIFMIYEYFQLDLEKEINALQKKQELFSEKMLCLFFEDSVKALMFLELLKRKYLDLRINSVYLSENKAIKFAYTNYHSTNMEKIKKQEVSFYK